MGGEQLTKRPKVTTQHLPKAPKARNTLKVKCCRLYLGSLGRGEDAGAGQDDRAHGANRGRAGREAPDHGNRPPKKR